ncbi:glycosyl transferase [Apodospora peruviana]|uniref:Glycosyl transferase n=1 Tax=Apodospora peruviana TaxID=516989 RepID=A0AAE0M058_9PEZI|nr:glycosyl transferase [Apodospora peruviana]
MKPKSLGLLAVGWKSMIKNRWGQILAAIAFATLLIALPYVLYHSIRFALRRFRNRRRRPISRAVGRCLEDLRSNAKPLTTKSTLAKRRATEAVSFGVFLGSFSSPPTVDERRLLSRWNVLVVDPLQAGVLDALKSCLSTSTHVLGRLDVSAIVEAGRGFHDDHVVKSLGILVHVLDARLASTNRRTPFTGILLAGWAEHFRPAVINKLARLVSDDMGLDMWLEMSHPDYITEDEARSIDMSLVGGVVYRNGMIHPNGEWKNFFQMTAMRTVQRAVKAQKVTHNIPTVIWETVNNDVKMDYAAVARAHKLYTFYNALSWIGHADALVNARAAKTRTVHTKPLGALMWLKNEKNMEAHDLWRRNNDVCTTVVEGNEDLYDSLARFIPNISSRLRLNWPPPSTRSLSPARTIASTQSSYSAAHGYPVIDPLSMSSRGVELSGLGCFQLGHESTFAEFEDLRRAQRKLERLNLLAKVTGEQLAEARKQIAVLRDPRILSTAVLQVIPELLDLLDSALDEKTEGNVLPRLKVFSGLHSAFQTTTGAQYWGLYDYNSASSESDCLVLYLSNFAENRAAAILHTFLSSRKFSRLECFVAEQAMADAIGGCLDNRWGLASRLSGDVETLSPSEAMLLLERLPSRHYTSLLNKVRDCIEYQLLEVPTLAQQRTLGSKSYLSGELSAEALVAARLEWLASKGCAIPDQEEAVRLFEDVQSRLYTVLTNCEGDVYMNISAVMQQLLQEDRIDAAVDILALSIFSAFRNFSLDEVYLEVLDRNVYPNTSYDQPGCFAEHFALGSRCESFFDTDARHVGRIIAARYREYYMRNQPPVREEGFTELPTAYAAMQADFDPTGGREKLPFYYNITFFGIFALPALFDVMLLTTIGRGLFLTTFMTSDQKTMATSALMLALLVSGAFGAWICSGGSYYFFASAFPAMNQFVLTRFAAGVAFTLAIALIGFVTFLAVKGIFAALTFAFYLILLSTYMMVLSALSIYQSPGSRFLSGRTSVLCCVPILFISPILSMWTGNDIIVYVPVLTAFLIAILIVARSTIGSWSSWHLKIPLVADAEVMKWYKETPEGSAIDLKRITDEQLMHRARMAIHLAVLRETERWLPTKSKADPLIIKLAKGYPPTMFLMRWYTAHKRSKMPLVYSTTWNLTMKAATESMTKMQKGLKLHSAFLHWRTTGLDVWSGLLYFLVALTDKWVALLTGANLVGLSAASSETFRLGVGWGLSYYLMGALMLDIVSQPLWTLANEKSTTPISSLKSLDEVTAEDAFARRKLYWQNLLKFFFLHLWAVSIFTFLMWVFQDNADNSIMFLCYVGAYSGLLFFQYNKVFCGFGGEKPLAIAVIVGFPIGFALHAALPNFAYSGVISLSAANWTAGILSLFVAKLGWPTLLKKPEPYISEQARITDSVSAPTATYSVATLEPYPELAMSTMQRMFDAVQRLDPDKRVILNPAQHPATKVVSIISWSRSHGPGPCDLLRYAFPRADALTRLATESWQQGLTTVELISANDFPPLEPKVRAIARKQGNHLHIFILLATDSVDEWALNVHRHWRIIAETIVQATAEHRMMMSHGEAMMAELVVAHNTGDYEIAVPEGVKYQLEASRTERARFIAAYEKTLLRYLLLGIDSEIEWDHLPRQVRAFLLQRLSRSNLPLSPYEETWLRKHLGVRSSLDVEVWIARCELAAAATQAIFSYAHNLELDDEFETDDYHSLSPKNSEKHPLLTEWAAKPDTSKRFAIKSGFASLLRRFNTAIKFLIISLTADPEYQRELDFVIHDVHSVIRWPTVFFLNGIWLYARFLQRIIVPVVLLYGRDHAAEIRRLIKGTTTVLEKDRIITENLSGVSTWFWTLQDRGNVRVAQYAGRIDSEPKQRKGLKAVNIYNAQLVLQKRQLYDKDGSVANSFTYHYKDDSSRLPLQRECSAGKLAGQVVQYDHRGYQKVGSFMRGTNRVDWKLYYRKSAKHEDELLWGEYVFPHITIKVLWSMPPRNPLRRLEEWIPFSTVTEATYIQGNDTWHASWDYEHKFHPQVAVTLNGQPVDTPPMIGEDWFRVLKKPDNCSFLSENPFLPFSSLKTNAIARFFGFNVKRFPIPTSMARTQVWKAWRSDPDVDAVSARWLDEKLMRSDAILRPYWRLRDLGRLEAAKTYLDAQADAIMARVDVDPATSSWTHLAYKMSDIYSFGQGGDARINTRKLESQLADSEYELHVLAMDTSTWPNDPGGVSNCRRDMINNLNSIKWHVVAETANDYGVPRYQIERNVQSLTILPLWGLDFLNPAHGVLETQLDSAIIKRSITTTEADIVQNFLPILTSLVRCAQAIKITRQHVEEATRALVDLNTYFESSRNYNDVWNHPVVMQRWCELWLSEDLADNAVTISQWWDFERPTLKHLENALNLWMRYLFIFALPVPEEIPDIFQASHHFCGAMYGIVCKEKRGCSLHIWDHCISFREFTTFMGSAVSFDNPFVNSTLISLTHLSCVLLEHHADVVLPCCDYFNPGWEVELGTQAGTLEHRSTFARKIDPVVNGISNMESFEPIKTIKTSQPTVVMLSHVQYPKDLKNAILAADVIVNKWGFRDYQLHMYGDQERHATLATELIELISSKNLGEHCFILGLAKPDVVLQDAWLFLNSSISEGLPLAMGEAALTGVPVVCTDVGASYCVVTDRKTGLRFSEVVPPNDSESLARAQISVMALIGPWAKYADDKPGTDVPELAYPVPSPEQVKRIQARIYAKTEQRRALGLRGRENVLKNFSSERYLREHEQMLWIGKDRSRSNRARMLAESRGANTPPVSGKYRALRHRNSRLTPESWISLASETGGGGKKRWWDSTSTLGQ